MASSVSPATMAQYVPIPKARKSFKGSAPKKLPKLTADEDEGWTASEQPGSSIMESMGATDETGAVSEGDGLGEMMQVDGEEENNNDAATKGLEDAGDVYEYEDEGGIDINDVLDMQGGESDDESFPSDSAKELFQKMPLQAQPHRIHKNPKTMHYQCPYCSFVSLYYSAVSNHTLIHTGEKPYQCHLCNYRARQRGHIIIHMRIHSGKKPFKCTQCSYSTIQRNHLRVHMQVHSQDRPFQCPGCTYRSKHLSILQMHVRKYQHNRTFECDRCDYTTARKHNLIQHMSIHTGAKPFKCDMCPYESSQKGHLNVHIRTHTREKPYRCHECPFASIVPKSLREHMGMHQGRRPHQCPHCTFSTIQSFSLKKHVALHATKDAAFQCSHCSYSSRVREDFLMHRTIHAMSSAYFCTSCDFTTPFKYQYTTHMRSHAQTSEIPKDLPADNGYGPNSALNGPKGKGESPSKMIAVKGKLHRKSDTSRKNGKDQKKSLNGKRGSKLKISIGSLVNRGKTTPTKTKNQQNSGSDSPSSSQSDTSVPPETSSLAKKKSKKAFVCLYCDTKLLNQEDWVVHEMRHFNAWPEIV